MIEIQHLTKRYGQFTAVNDLTFSVNRGEIVGFLGPNGAGKTTTMRILAGYMPPSDGKAVIAGYDTFQHPLEAKKRTGYLPETPPLYLDMSVLEYLDFVGRLRGLRGPERKTQVANAIERTKIGDMATRLCGKLSKGYRQRVGLAQALLHDPEVLILDEPTSHLDPKQILETRSLIKELADDHTVILSTHILPEVSQTCQRVVIINQGRMVAVDTPENLTARLHGSETVYLQVDAQGADPTAVLERVPGVTRVSAAEVEGSAVGYTVESESDRDVRRTLASEVVAQGWGLLELRPLRVSLEDVFLHLTTEEQDADADSAAGRPEVIDA